MKQSVARPHPLIAFVLLLIPCLARWALAEPADAKPAVSNVRGQAYPKIDSDLRAIFRIEAPHAQKVQIRLDKTYDMVKDDEGVWTVTTDPLVPGFHYYFLRIDDVEVADPASESFFGNINIFDYYVSNFLQIFLFIAASGMILGALSSWFAVIRYLKA